jgi:hypothetical protein
MAIQKHENRRDKVVADANSVGDFYTTASLLNEPLRSHLQAVIREYANHRLEVVRRPGLLTEADLDREVAQVNALHSRMTELVRQVSDQHSPVTMPLVLTLNNLTSNHAARLAAARDRLPGSIVLLLVVAAVGAVGLLGREQGLQGKRALLSTLFLIVMITFTLYTTLDLNQPARGMIQVSQEPMKRLIESMGP